MSKPKLPSDMYKNKEEGKADMFKIGTETTGPPSNYPTTWGCEAVEAPVNPRENDNWAAMSTFCCETCMYYINFRCRRHSPAGQEGWSAVYNTDWCGDHKITKLKMALLKA